MEKMREEFEKAVLSSELLPCNSIVKIEGCDDYSSVLTGVAWLSWQASRAALCVELPDAERSVGCGDVLYRSDVEDALIAAGIRYV